jgi:WD40 repeat protein
MPALRLLLGGALLTMPLALAAHAAEDRLGDPLPDGAVQRLGTLRLRYSGGIADLRYLPDGRGLIAVGNQIEIWDLAAGELQAKHQVCEGRIASVALRSDAGALLVADTGGTVHEWDLTNAAELRSWETGQSGLRTAHYSPDEQRVLTTGSKPPTIKEWDLPTGRELVSITGRMHYFHEGIYGPDGKTAFVNGGAGSEPILAHYDLATGEPLNEWLPDYYAHARSIVLSEDGARLLVGSRHKATEWRIDGYELLKEFTGHQGHAVVSVAYCKEPDQLLTGSRDGSIRRWNRIEGELLLRWCPHEAYVTHMQVSPDGQWVLSYGSGMVAETSLADGKPRATWERHSGPVNAVAVLPSGGTAVSGSTDTTLRVWDIATGECSKTIGGAALGAYAIAVSPDGARAAVGCKDGVLREFALADGSLIRELTGHRGYVRSVAYAPQGDHLLSSAGDGQVRIWSREADEPVHVLEGHRGGVLSVAVSPDGKQALSGGRDGTVRLWDLQAAALLRTLTGHRGWVQAVAFAGGNAVGLSGAVDGRILKWDLSTGELLGEMSHGGVVYALACTSDGKTAYAGGGGGITSWDLGTAEKTAELTGHEGAVLALAMALDEQRLVSASQDTTLLVWQIP